MLLTMQVSTVQDTIFFTVQVTKIQDEISFIDQNTLFPNRISLKIRNLVTTFYSTIIFFIFHCQQFCPNEVCCLFFPNPVMQLINELFTEKKYFNCALIFVTVSVLFSVLITFAAKLSIETVQSTIPKSQEEKQQQIVSIA